VNLVTLAELFPFLGPAAGVVVGLFIGVFLHRKFVMTAVTDGDRAHEQAIATHRNIVADLVAEFGAYRERTAAELSAYRERSAAEMSAHRELAAAEQGRLEERLATIGKRLDECRTESHELITRVAVLEAAQPARVSVVENLTHRSDIKEK
jgi:hypothetical protein